MRIKFLLNTCPITNRGADYRMCVNCKYQKGFPKTGYVDCTHPKVTKNEDKSRMEAIKASVGVQHILQVD